MTRFWKCGCGYNYNMDCDTTCRSCKYLRTDRARTDDPWTSHAAGATAKIGKRQQKVIAIMQQFNQGQSWIADDIEAHENGLWRRIGELEKLGKIRFTGETREGKSGKQQREFVLT